MLEIRFENSTLRVSVLFLVSTVIVLSLDRSGVGILCLLFSCLHECGHLCAFAVLGHMPSLVTVGIGGLRIEHAEATLSYKRNIAVSLSGPAVNGVCAVVCAAVGEWVAMWASVLLGIMQLLPVRSLDGGQALYCALCLYLPHEKAQRVVGCVSVGCMVCISAYALYAAAVWKNIWLVLVVCYLFIGFFANSS